MVFVFDRVENIVEKGEMLVTRISQEVLIQVLLQCGIGLNDKKLNNYQAASYDLAEIEKLSTKNKCIEMLYL